MYGENKTPEFPLTTLRSAKQGYIILSSKMIFAVEEQIHLEGRSKK